MFRRNDPVELPTESPIASPPRLMRDPSARESRKKRATFLIVALILAAAHAFFLDSFFAPAPGRPGIDENAYLVAGKNIAEHGTPGFRPSDDFQYVGMMWVRTKDETHAPPAWLPGFIRNPLTVHTEAGWYYPKYPAGLPLMNALAIKIGGAQHWRATVFRVSPICMTLAVLGMFFFTRALVGSFEGILAMIVLATIPTSLEFAEIPGSHAPALAAVVWGMFFLARWWQTASWWRGALAGLILGFSICIRYTEALLLFPLYPLDLVLGDLGWATSHPHLWTCIRALRFLPVGPLGIAALMSIRWRRPMSYLRAAVPIIGWGIPVAIVVGFNWFSMGHLTGYDTTNESAGFSTGEFVRKWDFAIQELYLYGLVLFLPLGIAGLVMMFRASRRAALMLMLWFVPGTLLYMTYYWGTQAPGIGFLRFFLTLFPPLIIAAMWLLRSAGSAAENRKRGTIASPLAASILTAATAAIGLFVSLPNIERQHRGNLNLQYSARETLAGMHLANRDSSARPLLFADNGLFPMHLQYLQLVVDADCYEVDAFEVRSGGGFGIFGEFQRSRDGADKPTPVLIQQERIDYMSAFRKNKSDAELIREQHRVIDAAIDSARPVYALLTDDQAKHFRARAITPAYEMTMRSKWSEPCAVIFPGGRKRDGSTPEVRDTSPLSPPVLNGEPFIRWQPIELTLFEIRRAAPTTAPAKTSS